MRATFPAFLMLLAVACPAVAGTNIVAAENFYGDVARQIAGPDASVTSIMSNPEQDPHLFEASPSVARALSRAQDRDLQRRRLRPVDGEAAERGATRGARRCDRGRRPGAQEAGRQSASLVRPGHHARLCARAGRRAGSRRPGATRRRTSARLAAFLGSRWQPLDAEDRGDAGTLCRHAGHRDRAGVRPNGGGARAWSCATSGSSWR